VESVTSFSCFNSFAKECGKWGCFGTWIWKWTIYLFVKVSSNGCIFINTTINIGADGRHLTILFTVILNLFMGDSLLWGQANPPQRDWLHPIDFAQIDDQRLNARRVGAQLDDRIHTPVPACILELAMQWDWH
jgi:hypothetical protein